MICFVVGNNSEQICATVKAIIDTLTTQLSSKKDDEWDGVTD